MHYDFNSAIDTFLIMIMLVTIIFQLHQMEKNIIKEIKKQKGEKE